MTDPSAAVALAEIVRAARGVMTRRELADQLGRSLPWLAGVLASARGGRHGQRCTVDVETVERARAIVRAAIAERASGI